jgi:predicted metal-binding membrane protein
VFIDRVAPLEVILKRDRAIVVAGLIGITLLAWGYMVYEAGAMYHTGICSCAGMKMSGPDTGAWSTATLVPLFLMWAEMMVAMMIPSAAPMILTFAMVNRKRREQQRPFVPTGVFVLGYVLVWTVFSAMAALAQWILHAKAMLSPTMVSTSPLLGGALLITAGIFQWTPLKNSCLTHCRSPLSFLMTGWREGKRGALRMGLKHGTYCTGCCWFLMALLFVAGVMNIWWIAIISVFVLLEKIAPRGVLVGKIAGGLLAIWGRAACHLGALADGAESRLNRRADKHGIETA